MACREAAAIKQPRLSLKISLPDREARENISTYGQSARVTMRHGSHPACGCARAARRRPLSFGSRPPGRRAPLILFVAVQEPPLLGYPITRRAGCQAGSL